MSCPLHPDAELVPAQAMRGLVKLLVCTRCDHCEVDDNPARHGIQPKLPHLDRGRQTRRTHIAEDVAQDAVVTTLRADGYTVLVTSRRRKRVRCNRCNQWQWPEGGDGVTPGLPDLLVSRDTWPSACWLGLEMKGTDTPLSAEQADLEAEGRVIVLRAAESLDATVREARRMVGEFGERIAAQ